MLGMTILETRFEEIERAIKDEATTTNLQIEETHSKISEILQTSENQGEDLTQLQAMAKNHESLICQLE